MAAQRDYYQVLGVPRDADAKAIKDAFRRLARRYHPDTSTEPDAEDRFKEIAEAYGILSDSARRRDYDASGPATRRRHPCRGGGAAAPGAQRRQAGRHDPAAVPAPGRRLRVTVPPATQPGAVLRITGRGLPCYGQHGQGDLNVRVIVDIPRQLSPQQRRLYEQLRTLQ